ncbi:heterogeneous nuclear ribonucleoprotein 27C isoform X3 [Hyposmocoma kahamanoa]|uniref:heterogeneous nuclear ribonucleoprotein 27C isoform X3 n=1 Tax=Hyposmocoma kahamanoa TaxID=1477025 RepID=UPI000E6D672B|nr:heterogeneous nuclear ribonucleoprotein 27C isoform X3 [Hyposmocoma kahamanoa]
MRMTQDMDDDEKGKLFVGGLSWETSQENLQRYFSRYGDVIDCVVMKNSESGRSRGFGFVTFAEPSLVNVVLQNGPHQLDGRTIDPKPCNPRTLQKPKRGGGYPKVFLGGLPSNVTETDLRVFFGRYGKVMEVVIMYDQEKKKSRGFGFLSFEDEISVERVTQEHFINLNGKQVCVEIKRAEPRDGSGKMGTGGGGMGGGGMNAPGDQPAAGQWGPPAPAINIMQGHNGQMGGPPINMPMAGPNIMQGYQGWGTSPGQTSYAGYGAAGAAARARLARDQQLRAAHAAARAGILQLRQLQLGASGRVGRRQLDQLEHAAELELYWLRLVRAAVGGRRDVRARRGRRRRRRAQPGRRSLVRRALQVLLRGLLQLPAVPARLPAGPVGRSGPTRVAPPERQLEIRAGSGEGLSRNSGDFSLWTVRLTRR